MKNVHLSTRLMWLLFCILLFEESACKCNPNSNDYSTAQSFLCLPFFFNRDQKKNIPKFFFLCLLQRSRYHFVTASFIRHLWSLFIPSSYFNAAKRPEIRTQCKLLHLESIESNAYAIVQSSVQAYFMQRKVEAFLCNIEQATGKTTAKCSR